MSSKHHGATPVAAHGQTLSAHTEAAHRHHLDDSDAVAYAVCGAIIIMCACGATAKLLRHLVPLFGRPVNTRRQRALRYLMVVWFTVGMLCLAFGRTWLIAAFIYLFGLLTSALLLWTHRKRSVPIGPGGVFGDAHDSTAPEIRRAGYISQPGSARPSAGIPLGHFRDMSAKSSASTQAPSLSDPDCIRYNGPGHLMTIASARSGKMRDVICTAMLSSAMHSVICIDPKAQAACLTHEARARMGNKVYVLNPFGVEADHLPNSVSFNVLNTIRADSPTFAADCDAVAAAMVVESGGDDRHFTDAAAMLISGVILFVCKYCEPDERDLATVVSVIGSGPDYVASFVQEALAKGDLELTQRLSRCSKMTPEDREANNILSTANVQLKFLANKAMYESVSGQGIDIADLRSKEGATVYLIVPGKDLNSPNIAKWLRLVVDSMLRSLLDRRGEEVVMVLDEFPALGYLPSIESAMGLAAGYKVKLWPILQDLPQLTTKYATWKTFIANTGVRQFFAPKDPDTLKYLSEACGTRTIYVESESFGEVTGEMLQRGMDGRGRNVSPQPYPLHTPQEIAAMLANRPGAPNLQFLFMDGLDNVVVAERHAYFSYPELKGAFGQDPEHRQ